MLCLAHTVIRTPFGDEGRAFHSGPMMAVEQTWTLHVPRASSSLQTSDCSSQKHNLVPHSPPMFTWSRQLGKEKGVYTTILLTTSQEQQQQEHQVPSPVSFYAISVYCQTGWSPTGGWSGAGACDVSEKRLEEKKWACAACKRAGWGQNWLHSSTSCRGKIVVNGPEVTVTGCSKRKPCVDIRSKAFTVT